MQKELAIILLSLAFIIQNCSNVDSEISKKNSILLDHLLTGSYILIYENEMEVKGEMVGDSISVKYYSVNPEEYFSEFEESKTLKTHFTRDHRFNEILGQYAVRKNDSLILKGRNRQDFLLKDGIRDFYFYEGKVLNLHIVKSIQFEDSRIMFINYQDGVEAFSLLGLSLSKDERNNLIFYSDDVLNSMRDSTEIAFYKVNSNKLDTLLSVQTKWFSNFSFFKNSNEIYYLHSVYEDGYKMKSTYAKMEIIYK